MATIVHILTIIYQTIMDALFPLSKTEQELLSYSPEEAFSALSHVSALHDLAVPTEKAADMSAIFSYKDERVAKLIWDVKYKKSPKAVAIGAYALWRGLRAFPHTTLIVIPMPMTSRRYRERGFNQCELLATAVKKLDTDHSLIIATDLLIRTQHASRQTLKGREDRLKDAKGIFSINKETVRQWNKTGIGETTDVRDIPVVIIDDVITTGSTMNEALETMRFAGFNKVYGLSLAH